MFFKIEENINPPDFILIFRLKLVNVYLKNWNCNHVSEGMWIYVWILPKKQHR
jgi:hypothetical protein